MVMFDGCIQTSDRRGVERMANHRTATCRSHGFDVQLIYAPTEFCTIVDLILYTYIHMISYNIMNDMYIYIYTYTHVLMYPYDWDIYIYIHIYTEI